MRLDATRIWSTIERHLSDGTTPGRAMQDVLDACDRSLPDPGWAQFRGLDYDGATRALSRWATDELRRIPATIHLDGLWFGLVEPVLDSGGSVNGLYLAGSTAKPSDSTEWLDRIDYRLDAATYAPVQVLEQLPVSSSPTPFGIQEEASWALPLAFAALAVRAALPVLRASADSWARFPVSVAVGFDSGDFFRIGDLTRDGLRLRTAE